MVVYGVTRVESIESAGHIRVEMRNSEILNRQHMVTKSPQMKRQSDDTAEESGIAAYAYAVSVIAAVELEDVRVGDYLQAFFRCKLSKVVGPYSAGAEIALMVVLPNGYAKIYGCKEACTVNVLPFRGPMIISLLL